MLGDSPTPKQPDEAGDCPVGDAQESGGRVSWEILPFGGDREEALRFGGGAQGDTGVSTEQSGGPERVPLDEVDVDGECCPTELVYDGPGGTRQTPVGGLERAEAQLLSKLPGLKRPIAFHTPTVGRHPGFGSTNLLRSGS